MVVRVRATPALLAMALVAVLTALAGCGAGAKSDPASASAAAEVAPSASCAQTVMSTLGIVLERVYHEGVESERTASAEDLIEYSLPLRLAIEQDSPSAARAAAKELLATGHMTNLTVRSDGRVLVAVGGHAIAPLHGVIKNLAGAQIATYSTSVWSDSGFSSETSGVAEGLIAIRLGDRTLGGTLPLPAGPLPAQGSVTHRGSVYDYTSFGGEIYPTGASAQIYLLKPQSAIAKLCGASQQDTVVDTLQRVANLIYEGEAGPRTLVQIHRVQAYAPLLRAVAAREPAATAEAVATLLHHHLVRLRVLAGGQLLDDDGGPYVLAPVHAPLRYQGRRIGSIVVSIQDDEGYLRLTRRLAGLDVLMYMAPEPGQTKPRLVKNSLGPEPGQVPASGTYVYKGKQFRVFTVHATAFPSGPLTIRVLVPIPYT
jgi:hypothetical protein